jgi:teichuronic acid biosynthesis glycosyltransferase TuaH
MGIYPGNIDEYLAAGKPVVATATAAMDMFREYAELCHSKEDFVLAIRRLVNEPDPGQCLLFYREKSISRP